MVWGPVWNLLGIPELGFPINRTPLASSPGHSQILSHSREEKLGEGLVSLLRHKLEMVDSVCTKIWSGLKIRLVHSHKRVNLKIPSPLDIIKNAQNTPQTSLNFTLNPSDLQAKNTINALLYAYNCNSTFQTRNHIHSPTYIMQPIFWTATYHVPRASTRVTVTVLNRVSRKCYLLLSSSMLISSHAWRTLVLCPPHACLPARNIVGGWGQDWLLPPATQFLPTSDNKHYDSLHFVGRDKLFSCTSTPRLALPATPLFSFLYCKWCGRLHENN